jgi:hypothetical protein
MGFADGGSLDERRAAVTNKSIISGQSDWDRAQIPFYMKAQGFSHYPKGTSQHRADKPFTSEDSAQEISDAVPRADGGETHVPIVAAGGEYIIHPDVVRDIGHGNMTHGHKVLDAFVLHTRKEHIKTLKKLPGPKQ